MTVCRSRVLAFLVVLAPSLVFMKPRTAYAGDAATIIFRSGQTVVIDDGYRQVVDAVKSKKSSDSKASDVIELTLGGSSFLLDVSQIVIVCRDNCANLTIKHQLDPKRGRGESDTGR